MDTTIDSGARARALRRHWKNPQRVAIVRATVRAGVLADEALKNIASALGITHGKVCRWAHTLGFRLMYVTHEERHNLLELRRSQAKEAIR